MDTVLMLSAYSQLSLCRTKAMNLSNYEILGAGINTMVYIMSYRGYNIEDAKVYTTAVRSIVAMGGVLFFVSMRWNWKDFPTVSMYDIILPTD
ncbi:hypothetical protein, unlikely [Trypanosoma brucei gambiense DAL972]|uniref:DNA-directed RNA polymerase n=1 Tax=Trypanosoma brucei gambiense (strain MHOM/CI/86/DAL972) TaxID=679716 RepID=D0A6M0_TRYB9|nr:hypothetical protein, unlikely [Trypanosoma brucei gambiense DAL972]CBH17321.1 hypothetical protein, unlikely [Trypanosoma brucei gambiense DAL972]|eukprot:XP_011779585.1 hypothetical protein, unlikely [Trypanosoma brucei gambiense DAL972]